MRHIVMRLPDEQKAEYIFMTPFTPRQKDNLAAWMIARNDGEHYGKLLVYRFPKQSLIFGPKQIVNRINQDTEISRQITLWDQRGSEVIRGELLVIPIEKSLLYVQPIYLRAEGGQIPELKRVVVAHQNQVVMAETLDAGLSLLFGGSAGRPSVVVDSAQASAPAAAGGVSATLLAPGAGRVRSRDCGAACRQLGAVRRRDEPARRLAQETDENAVELQNAECGVQSAELSTLHFAFRHLHLPLHSARRAQPNETVSAIPSAPHPDPLCVTARLMRTPVRSFGLRSDGVSRGRCCRTNTQADQRGSMSNNMLVTGLKRALVVGGALIVGACDLAGLFGNDGGRVQIALAPESGGGLANVIAGFRWSVAGPRSWQRRRSRGMVVLHGERDVGERHASYRKRRADRTQLRTAPYR
jgi:hypothetical protein